MKLGLALAGGGIRGFAHAGALRAFEEHGIKFDVIGGTSSGSMVTALYAMGISPYYVYILAKKYSKEIVTSNNLQVIIEMGSLLFNKKVKFNGLNSGEQIETLFNEVAKKRGYSKISDLDMSIVIPTVDIVNSKKYVIASKPLDDKKYISDISIGKAVRASASFPLIFGPCQYKNKLFMDGGILDNVPALEVKQLGVDKVISITFSSDKITKESNTMDIVMKTLDIMGNKVSDESLEASDLVLTIPTDNTGLLEIDKLDQCYKSGYNTVVKNIEKIKKVIGMK